MRIKAWPRILWAMTNVIHLVYSFYDWFIQLLIFWNIIIYACILHHGNVSLGSFAFQNLIRILLQRHKKYKRLNNWMGPLLKGLYLRVMQQSFVVSWKFKILCRKNHLKVKKDCYYFSKAQKFDQFFTIFKIWIYILQLQYYLTPYVKYCEYSKVPN